LTGGFWGRYEGSDEGKRVAFTAAFSLPGPVPAVSTKAADYGADWNLPSIEHERYETIATALNSLGHTTNRKEGRWLWTVEALKNTLSNPFCTSKVRSPGCDFARKRGPFLALPGKRQESGRWCPRLGSNIPIPAPERP